MDFELTNDEPRKRFIDPKFGSHCWVRGTLSWVNLALHPSAEADSELYARAAGYLVIVPLTTG